MLNSNLCATYIKPYIIRTRVMDKGKGNALSNYEALPNFIRLFHNKYVYVCKILAPTGILLGQMVILGQVRPGKIIFLLFLSPDQVRSGQVRSGRMMKDKTIIRFFMRAMITHYRCTLPCAMRKQSAQRSVLNAELQFSDQIRLALYLHELMK